MAKITFVPWYVADWLADTADLDPVEYWIYHRLLMQIYKDGAMAERSQIERIARNLREEDKPKVDWVLKEYFYEVREGEKTGYMNKRALAEIEKIAEKSEKARKIANMRYNKGAEPTQCQRNANAMPMQCQCRAKAMLLRTRLKKIYIPPYPLMIRNSQRGNPDGKTQTLPKMQSVQMMFLKKRGLLGCKSERIKALSIFQSMP